MEIKWEDSTDKKYKLAKAAHTKIFVFRINFLIIFVLPMTLGKTTQFNNKFW